jgi:DNA-binding HxlR family transcriptional regulator
MNAQALSVIRISETLSKGPISFSDLVQETQMSSRTLDKWLKQGVKLGFIARERQRTFPRKSTYSLKQSAALIRIMGGYIRAWDNEYRHLLQGINEQYVSAEEAVKKALTRRAELMELALKIDASWMKPPLFDFIQILFSAMNAINFWGMFFVLRARAYVLELQDLMASNFTGPMATCLANSFLPSSTNGPTHMVAVWKIGHVL